jgi:hypothetical protein
MQTMHLLGMPSASSCYQPRDLHITRLLLTSSLISCPHRKQLQQQRAPQPASFHTTRKSIVTHVVNGSWDRWWGHPGIFSRISMPTYKAM